MKSRFNAIIIYNMLDQVKAQRGVLWRDVAKQAGVAPSMFSRMHTGRCPDLNSFAKLCKWANFDANEILGVTNVETNQGTILAISRDSKLTKDQKQALATIIRAFYAKE